MKKDFTSPEWKSTLKPWHPQVEIDTPAITVYITRLSSLATVIIVIPTNTTASKSGCRKKQYTGSTSIYI